MTRLFRTPTSPLPLVDMVFDKCVVRYRRTSPFTGPQCRQYKQHHHIQRTESGSVHNHYPIPELTPINGWRLSAVSLSLADTTLNAFTNDSLPSIPPSLSAFGNRTATFTFRHRMSWAISVGSHLLAARSARSLRFHFPPPRCVMGRGFSR